MAIKVQDTEIKAGYKQTEVGVIPEDWKLKSFRDVCRVNQGLQIAIENRLKNPTKNSKIYITIQYLNDGKEAEYIDEYTQSVCCDKDDILMTRTGNTGFVVSGIEGVFHNNFFKVNYNKDILDKDFLIYYLNLKSTQNIILTKAGTSTIPDLNHNDFYSIPIPLPTKSEQTAIATVLSDIDSLIISLNKLIAKKRDIKQATMQQLLTGKMRLPGFSKKWEVKMLGEILRIRHGRSQHNVVVSDGRYPILATSGEIGRTNDYLYDKPSVLIGRKGTIDSPQYMDTPFWTIDTLFYTEISDHSHPKFIFYLFNMIDWLRYNEASGVPSLSASTIENIEVQCPPFSEQTAIATVLSDMDAEIVVLEQKRDKTRALKQGMMQELLTGKTRLL